MYFLDIYLCLQFNDMMLCCVEKGKILKRVTYTVRHKLDVDGMKVSQLHNMSLTKEVQRSNQVSF